MTALHYRSYFVPAANKVAANVAMALLFNSLGYGDDPAVSPPCGNAAVPASGPDDAAATYYYGGEPVDDALIAGMNALGTTVPLPAAFSWPVTGVGGVAVSEAEALAAAATIFYDTQTTINGTPPNSITSKVAAMTALGDAAAAFVHNGGSGLKDQMIGGGGLQSRREGLSARLCFTGNIAAGNRALNGLRRKLAFFDTDPTGYPLTA